MKYCENDLVRIAKRENNTKRAYVVVNPLQGKHIPVSPLKALDLFKSLANEINVEYKGEKLLVVGFAETATAIGAQVAISLRAKYIQTTREIIQGVKYLYFSEAHSHATQQKLVKDDIDKVINEIDRIIFVEDEVTTGNTILNIVKIIKKEYKKDIKFTVVSLLNGMTQEYLEVYTQENIGLHYLLKTDHSKYGEAAETFEENGKYIDVDDTESEISVNVLNGWMNARRVIDSSLYEEACKRLADEIINQVDIEINDNILIVGTEEFMFPALFVGEEIEKIGCKVGCHSTTRSPITVNLEERYPLHCRYTLHSLYDSARKTFIYNIDSYDKVIVITDSDLADKRGLQSLINVLKEKNTKITVIRWC